ncbi:MAG: PqiC family protein [Burkholderiales bacterium]
MKWRGALAVSLLALAACATPLPTRYYTLSGAAPPPATAASVAPGYRVAIGPVTVPEALDRPQIVLRVAPERYAFSDAARWSEPLKREIPRVIAEDVGRRLPAARVAANFQYGGQNADYRVLIDVLRFESVPGASATLEAVWSVRDRAGARLRETRSVFVETVNAAGVAVLVGAHEKALAALAQEIATAVAALAQAKQ